MTNRNRRAPPHRVTMICDPNCRRLLGLPSGLACPTAYDLLGIPEGTADAQSIRAALTSRKKRLRQQVRDERQIPLVRRAERQLDRAADLLLDPMQTAECGTRLRSRTERDEGMHAAASQIIEEAVDEVGTLEDIKRPALADRLRDLGMGDGDVDLTIASIPAPTLRVSAEERRAFFTETTDLNIARGLLPPENERALLGLASVLRLSTQQAQRIIEERLHEAAASRGSDQRDVLHAQLVRETRELFLSGRTSVVDLADLLDFAVARGLSDDAANSLIQGTLEACRLEAEGASLGNWPTTAGPIGETPGGAGAVSSEERQGAQPLGSVVEREPTRTSEQADRNTTAMGTASASPQARSAESSAWPLRLAIAGCVLAITAIIIVLSQYNARMQARPAPSTGHGQPPSPGSASTPVSAVAPKPVTTGQAATHHPPPSSDATPSSRNVGAPPPPPPVSPTLPRPPDVRDQLEQLRRGELRYSSSTLHEELLADLALTMLACRDRAVAFVQRAEFTSTELRDALGADKRVEFFAGKVTVAQTTSATTLTRSGPTASRLLQLRKELQSSDRAVRYAAVEALRLASSPEATELLLQRLEHAARLSVAELGRSFEGVPLASRILRAVSGMSDPEVPRRLIRVLARSGNNVLAFQIGQTLEVMFESRIGKGPYHQVADSYRDLRSLTRRQLGTEERRASAKAWSATLKRVESYEARQGSKPGTGRGTGTGALAPAVPQRSQQPKQTKQRLLIATVHYAKQMADVLDACTWPAPNPSVAARLSMAGSITTPKNINAELSRSLDRTVDRLAALVNARPKTRQSSSKLLRVQQSRRARTLASRTALQRMVVDLDAATSLLELLASSLARKGETKEELGTVSDERIKASRSATGILEEARESSFFNCFMWWRVFRLAEEGR